MKLELHYTQLALLSLAKEQKIPKAEVEEALVNMLVQDSYLNLGAAPNSPVHKALRDLSEKVWGLKEIMDKEIF
jgi:hypothetical protein